MAKRKEKAVKTIKDDAIIREYNALINPEDRKPLFRFSELPIPDQMAVVNNVYACLRDFFVRTAKRKILKLMLNQTEFGLDSEDELTFTYRWSVSAGTLYMALRQLNSSTSKTPDEAKKPEG